MYLTERVVRKGFIKSECWNIMENARKMKDLVWKLKRVHQNGKGSKAIADFDPFPVARKTVIKVLYGRR